MSLDKEMAEKEQPLFEMPGSFRQNCGRILYAIYIDVRIKEISCWIPVTGISV